MRRIIRAGEVTSESAPATGLPAATTTANTPTRPDDVFTPLQSVQHMRELLLDIPLASDCSEGLVKTVTGDELLDAVKGQEFVHSRHLLFVGNARRIPGYKTSLPLTSLASATTAVDCLLEGYPGNITVRRYDDDFKVESATQSVQHLLCNHLQQIHLVLL